MKSGRRQQSIDDWKRDAFAFGLGSVYIFARRTAQHYKGTYR